MNGTVYDDLGCFFAHALMLEQEAAEWLQEIAGMMQVHNNPELYKLFSELAGYSVQHGQEIEKLCSGMTLPELKPWQYSWPDAHSPESSEHHDLHYLMSEKDALQLVLANEQRARDFYRDVQNKASDARVRDYARQFAKEEGEHIALIEERIASSPEADQQWFDDIDSPHMPE